MRASIIPNILALAAVGAATAIPAASPVELAPRAENAALCPKYDGKSYTDSMGAEYDVTCYRINDGSVLGVTGDPTNLGQCMEACDQQSGCVAGLFHMGVNQCYLMADLGTSTWNRDYNLAVKKDSGSGDIGVTFSERKVTSFGQTVKIVGSIDALGNWDTGSAVSLDAAGYTSNNPVWSGKVNIAPGTTFQYKYIVVEGDGSITWEADPNHSYTVPETASNNQVSKSDVWQTTGNSASSTFASTVTNVVSATSTHSEAPTATCTNAPNSRDCWYGGYDVETDFDNQFPTTGRTVKYDWTISNISMSLDGFQRWVLAVEGQYPGPVLEANWGDNVEVTIRNDMPNNGTSIHWHGVRQLNNNGQDGVPGLTECPIAPGQAHTYKFQVTQYGSSWYHSHFSSQYGDGVVGPIVFHGPATANYDIDLGPLPVTDWYYDGVMYHASIAEHTNGLPPSADNALINGSMTSIYGGQYTRSTLTAGQRHRVRLMNVATDNHFVMSLDGHQMEVIASDFVPIEPFNTTNLFLGIGQRYDVIIHADQAPGSYWFRVEAQDSAGCGSNYNNGNIRSIFSYEGHEGETPISTAHDYSQRCTDETGLRPHWNSFVPEGRAGAEFTELTTSQLQAQENDGSITIYWRINGSRLQANWEVPTLEYVRTGNTSYPENSNVISLPESGKWTYWVIQEVAGDPFNVAVPHPIHLHGHDFYVLGAGDDTWSEDKVSQLNFNNPTRRDVAMLNTNGWLALAFVTDNPGAWLMHCHISWHSDEGLAVQFLETPEKIDSYAPDFDSQCSSWFDYYNGDPQYLMHDSGI
ncbi:Laccase-3 [Hortaea werneckii]|nr:Laccase-3 [Hortaea werneckii]KAI7081245.1 Laccase-3 [Hortaea werneckii]KAI7225583.1 Laccase-3 [Hortaea werneckii]KAI7314561.1 Laccase-3 [Hortaea werneckii]KAI7379069.1 Laccase-3 [Hortaea werneckii]